MTLQLMAVLVIAKIVATSFTISSGGSGGVFAPSLFIGAMLGGAFGQACTRLFPDIAPDYRAFVLVGMGGFFAGVAKVPLTGLIMVSEMCGSYDLLVALMIVCFLNVALISQRWTLYEEQVSSLIDSPAHLGDFVVDVLARIKVSEIFQPSRPPVLIREDMPLPEVLRIVADSDASYFPVVDRENRLVGFFSIHDTRGALLGDDGGGLVVASDLARQPVPTITPDDNLHTALKIYTSREVHEIPVVSSDDPKKVLCMLSRGDVIAAYDQQMNLLRAT
jgi:CIC family chloride channel protein